MSKWSFLNTTNHSLQILLNGIKYFFLALAILFLTSCQTMHDASYSAHVWEDVNGNGVQDSTELSMKEVVIQIIDPVNGTLWSRETTDTKGNIDAFSAGGTCGEYQIYLSVPNGYQPTTRIVVTTPLCEVAQFGLQPNH